MEAVIERPLGREGKFPWVFLKILALIGILLGVAFGIKAAMVTEVPLKPCSTCAQCPCPVGLNGPGCGCPR